MINGYLNSKNISSVCLNSETNISVSEYKNYKTIMPHQNLLHPE